MGNRYDVPPAGVVHHLLVFRWLIEVTAEAS